MKLKELLNGIPCRTEGPATSETDVADVVYDTRRLPEDAADILFVCITGFRDDGHDRAEEAYRKGVRLFAAQKPLSLPTDATVISTEDTRKFLALASANLFGRPAEKLFTVAITGTKGKTSTSFMLQSIFASAGIPAGVIGSTGIYYGDHFEETGNTTPESYLLHRTYRQMLDAGCKAVIIEAASQGFKLHRTYGIKFDVGIFTNFAPDHIGPGEHNDLEEYLSCKKQIFSQSKHCYVNRDDPHFEEIVRGVTTPYTVYGVESDVPLRAVGPYFSMNNHQLSTSFTAICGQERIPIELGVPGSFSISNAMAALAVAMDMNIPIPSIRRGLRNVHVRGRMEVLPIRMPFIVVIDAAHEEFGCRGLFETIHRYQPKRIISVFGCGGNRSKLRRYGMGEVIGQNSDLSIITSDNSRLEKTEDIIADILVGMIPTGGKHEIIIDRRKAIKRALLLAQPGDCILLIGKGHETYEDIGGKKTPFDERQIVLDFIAAGMPQDN